MNDTPTPRTDDSETRARKNGFSPLIEYCYANDMAKLETELTAVTEQRDEARKLAEKYRYLSCDSQEEADAEVLPWENNQLTEL